MTIQELPTYAVGVDAFPSAIRIDPETLRGPAEQAMTALHLLGGDSTTLRFVETLYELVQNPADNGLAATRDNYLPPTLQVDDVSNCILHFAFADRSPGGLFCAVTLDPPLRPAPITTRDLEPVHIMRRSLTRLEQAAPTLRGLSRSNTLPRHVWQMTQQAETDLRDGIQEFLQTGAPTVVTVAPLSDPSSPMDFPFPPRTPHGFPAVQPRHEQSPCAQPDRDPDR